MSAITSFEGIDVYWHDDVLLHDAGTNIASPILDVAEPHADSADRMRNMRSVLERGPLADQIRWRSGRYANEDELAGFHERRYIREVQELAARGGISVVDRYFAVSSGTWSAARAAAGSAIAAAKAATLTTQTHASLALTRPPGHHATSRRGEGYCIFNNVGLAALAAREAGAERVAIVDWDAHHGNGVQSFFYRRPDVLTVSVHFHTGPIRIDRSGGDGLSDETGAGAGRGATINVDLPPGTGDGGYRDAFEEVVGPALAAYRPDVLVAAMGQDAAMWEANGRQCLTMRGFHELGTRVAEYAHRYANGRLAMVEEGGYSLGYAPLCLYATLAGMLGRPLEVDDPVNYLPPDESTDHQRSVALARQALRECERIFGRSQDLRVSPRTDEHGN